MTKKNAPAESGAAEALASAEADIVAKGVAAAKAREVLDGLEAKLRLAQQREAALASERSEIAYAAHTAGGAAADKLALIHEAASKVGSEIAGLEAAIAEAARRVGAAETAQAHARERRDLQLVLARLDRCRELAAPLDKDSIAYFGRLAEIFGAFGDLARITDSAPTGGHIRVLGARALLTAAHEARHLLDLPFLAPSERITFTELTAGWLASVGGAAERRLAELGEAA